MKNTLSSHSQPLCREIVNKAMLGMRSVVVSLLILVLSALAAQSFANALTANQVESPRTNSKICLAHNLNLKDDDARRYRRTHHNKTAHIAIGSNKFLVPYQYITPVPGPEAIDCWNFWKTFGFSFQWPDREPADYDGYINLYNRQPAGRSLPGAATATVNVTQIAFIDLDLPENETLRPTSKFERVKRYLLHLKEVLPNLYGLTKLKSDFYDYPFEIYGSMDPTHQDIILRCTAKSEVSEKCFGSVYIASKKISFDFSMPKDLLLNTRDIVESCVNFLENWRVKTE